MITISLACAVFFRALYGEACSRMLLLGGKELPGPAKDIHGRVPTLADDIEVRLMINVSFAHGLATDPAGTGNDLPSLTSLDTPGVQSFETSAKIPLVHIDGGPFVHLLPDGDAIDFAAISLTLPIGLSLSSPLPEGRYTSGKYVKY
jgi:hypothetical protein